MPTDKLSHVFGRRKKGAYNRLLKDYMNIKAEVQTALMKDIENHLKNSEGIFKYNQALAITKKKRMIDLAVKEAKLVLDTVFNSYKAEVMRIANDLNGEIQEDGNILFPDGSVSHYPKAMFIPEEHRFQVEINE